MRKQHKLLALFAVLFSSVLFADEPPAKKPEAEAEPKIEMDARSRELFDAWTKMEYLPANAGLKSGSLKIEAEAAGWQGQMKGGATYSWDAAKDTSSLEWRADSAAIGQALAREGYSKESFDRWFLSDMERKGLEGCKLTSEEKDGNTKITVHGKAKSMVTSMQFDANGVLVQLMRRIPVMGNNVDLTERREYMDHGGKKLLSKEHYEMEMQGFGTVSGTTEYTYTDVGGFRVLSGIKQAGKMNGQPGGSKTIKITDYNVEGAAAGTSDKKPEK
ncbi:MAG: hypothetical protein V3T86_11100 [Planctomycetota bacterium]